MVDEMEAVTDLHPRSLVRLMKGALTRKQRGRTHGPQVEDRLAFQYLQATDDLVIDLYLFGDCRCGVGVASCALCIAVDEKPFWWRLALCRVVLGLGSG